ncbi:hypothetical protein MPL3365_170190 [Mesorhizobium plurifarium]|uniref:Uncharacterized protein n=1 Tax=Mesorhizobium plurifarium TaxID=69974 RepID=A0A090G613_MESPL|nr:hypothetical protein MPL3365_170190 [Mesorhizobium plurifarium]
MLSCLSRCQYPNGDAAGAIFAFVVGEVNATLFLVGPGLATIPIHVLSQSSSARSRWSLPPRWSRWLWWSH